MTPDLTHRLAARILEEILDHQASADGALRQLFSQRNSGSSERGRVGDLVFHALRHLRRLETLAEPAGITDRVTRLVALAAADLDTPVATTPSLPAPLRSSLPDWLWEAFVTQWGEEQALSLALALNQPASTDLRVNRARIDRETLFQRLLAAGIETTPLDDTPDALRLTGHPPVTTLEPFHEGLFEIQDKGSQWIAPLLGPRPGETVVDLCAGGGGKTLHLAALMRNQGRILATDTDARRLNRLTQRARRTRTNLVHVQTLRHERDPWFKQFVGKVDAVLVDAPCSGTGTLRRHPEIKWHLSPVQIATLADRQSALLHAAAALLKPGGRLVYATCSLLRQENQAVVEQFINENQHFRRIPAMSPLAAQGYAGLYFQDQDLVILPHVAGCDGFFAALLQRNR
ncbi:MAG: RsmB/NOP family class I SAM-dependent RNA methyltransferase [Magnetococcales bacterium]|nr:RsmB/NOP family class I SAM-dependent RNA methyltransferase [Magnetococcales bacterium]